VFGRLVHRDSGFAHGQPVFARQTRHHAVAAYEDTDYGFVFAQDGRPLLFGCCTRRARGRRCSVRRRDSICRFWRVPA